MKLKCRQCQEDVRASDLDFLQLTAHCQGCELSFHFGVPLDPHIQLNVALKQKPTVALPRGMKVSYEGMNLIISQRWFRWRYVVPLTLGLMGIAGAGFFYRELLVVFTLQLVTGNFTLATDLWAASALGGLFILLYFLLAQLFNRRTVSVTPQLIRIFAWPFPWLSRQAIFSTRLKKLYYDSHERQSRKGITTRSYTLKVSTIDDTQTTLFKSFSQEEQVQFLVDEMEKATHILNWLK